MFAVAEKTLTIKETLLWAEDYLTTHDVPDAKAEAEYLLAHVLGCKRIELHLNCADSLTFSNVQRFAGFIERRIKREPSQYIIGEQEFWGLVFKVAPDVLIPRPETELLVEEAVETVNCKLLAVNSKKSVDGSQFAVHSSRFTILDLCAGSGCIAIAIAKEIPDCRIYAVDISEKALNIAKENAERHDVADKIIFVHGDLFGPLKDINVKFDLIVSNPPYISKKMFNELQPEVKGYEPRAALYGGEDGLDFYRRIISESSKYLTPGGCLILEMGYGQAEEIEELMEQNKVFERIAIKKDFSEIDRVIKAEIKG